MVSSPRVPTIILGYTMHSKKRDVFLVIMFKFIKDENFLLLLFKLTFY